MVHTAERRLASSSSPVAKAAIVASTLRYKGNCYDASGASSFSAEDLVSNLIGFYAAFRGVTQDALRRVCGEVSAEASYAVWDNHVPDGLQTYRNRGYTPILFPCSECKGADTSFPKELTQLKAATSGDLYVAPEPNSTVAVRRHSLAVLAVDLYTYAVGPAVDSRTILNSPLHSKANALKRTVPNRRQACV